MTRTPRGFAGYTANLGIKDDSTDFAVVVSEVPASVAAVFTRSRFAGPSVTLSRAAAASGRGRGIVVLSKNANVATRHAGTADAVEIGARIAAQTGLAEDDLLLASTGVIGRRYPMERIRSRLDA